MPKKERLLSYGVSSKLAEKAEATGLGATKIRSLSKKDLVEKFGLEDGEAFELKKCVHRQAIDEGITDLLLDRSNHVCCICKGEKGSGVIIHHIVSYEASQDNSYGNLAVLCPNDHDRAHSTGLTLGLRPEQIQKAKGDWERLVEIQNSQKAAKTLSVDSSAVDYANIMRIEEMCMQLFGTIPPTTISASMQRDRILRGDRRFDEIFVRHNLSGRNFLFDYVNSGEAEHYRQLMKIILRSIDFEDLSAAARSGIRKLKKIEGSHAFFIGAVSSKRPKIPFSGSFPFEWKFRTGKVVITWHADAKYLLSMSAIGRQGALNRYLLYCKVGTVVKPEHGPIQVTCSPLLTVQPSVYVERTPLIAYQKRAEHQMDDEPDDAWIEED